MDIYIDDYVDYILYHPEHVSAVGYPDQVAGSYSTRFNNVMQQVAGNGLAEYYNAVISANRSKSPIAASSLEVLSSLTTGTTLDDILNQIANDINQGIEQASREVANLDYYEIQNRAATFSKALTSGPMSTQAVNEFFDLIIQGMSLAAQIDVTTLDQLTNIGQNLTNNPEYAIPREWYGRATVVELTPQDAQVANKVITYLTNAANKFRQGGRLTARSFASTITNIFSQAMRQPLSQSLLAKGIQAGLSDIENTLATYANSDPNLTLQFAPISTPKSAGRNQRLFNSNTFDITVTEGNQSFNIDLSVNSNVKWVRSGKIENNIKLISETSQLSPYLDLAGANIIAHRMSFDAEWNTLQAGVSASFLLNAIDSSTHLRDNNAQFIMFNDRVYSVLSVIRRICEQIMNQGRSSVISIEGLEKVDSANKWKGQKGRPSAYLAQLRSNLVNGVINTLTIAATLDSNTLKQYII